MVRLGLLWLDGVRQRMHFGDNGWIGFGNGWILVTDGVRQRMGLGNGGIWMNNGWVFGNG